MWTIVIMACCMLCMGMNSCRLWKQSPPANMLGHGSPLKDSCAPSVPPRMARMVHFVPAHCMACCAMLIIWGLGSIIWRMFLYWSFMVTVTVFCPCCRFICCANWLM